MIRLCFICLGNICRSPTAEGVMQRLIEQAGLVGEVQVDSAGTAAYHQGEAADARSRQAAEDRGYQLTSIARQAVPEDFQTFDYLLAMDQQNYEDLQALSPLASEQERLHLFRSFDPQSPVGASVPDPYYGGPGGFDEVLDICEAACEGLLQHILHNTALKR